MLLRELTGHRVDDLAIGHRYDVVAPVPGEHMVVGDEQNTHLPFVLDGAQDVEDGGLGGGCIARPPFLCNADRASARGEL